jgi:hypothetical protein
LEAQLRVERGGGNSLGLTIIQTTASAIGTSDHHPIQSRLQIATTSSGRTVNRVQTLSGLAWRIQVSPSSPNRRASLVCAETPGGGAVLAMTVSFLETTLVRPVKQLTTGRCNRGGGGQRPRRTRSIASSLHSCVRMIR